MIAIVPPRRRALMTDNLMWCISSEDFKNYTRWRAVHRYDRSFGRWPKLDVAAWIQIWLQKLLLFISDFTHVQDRF